MHNTDSAVDGKQPLCVRDFTYWDHMCQTLDVSVMGVYEHVWWSVKGVLWIQYLCRCGKDY